LAGEFFDLKEFKKCHARSTRQLCDEHFALVFLFLSLARMHKVEKYWIEFLAIDASDGPTTIEITWVGVVSDKTAIEIDGRASRSFQHGNHPEKALEQPPPMWRSGKSGRYLINGGIVNPWWQYRPGGGRSKIDKGRNHVHNIFVVYCPVNATFLQENPCAFARNNTDNTVVLAK